MKISNNAFTQTWCFVSHFCCPECLIPGSSWSSAVHRTCCYQHKKKTASSHYFLFLKTLPTLISYFLYCVCVFPHTLLHTVPAHIFSLALQDFPTPPCLHPLGEYARKLPGCARRVHRMGSWTGIVHTSLSWVVGGGWWVVIEGVNLLSKYIKSGGEVNFV